MIFQVRKSLNWIILSNQLNILVNHFIFIQRYAPPPWPPQACSQKGREGWRLPSPLPLVFLPASEAAGTWDPNRVRVAREGKQEAGCSYLMEWPGAPGSGRLQSWRFLLWMSLRPLQGPSPPLWSLHTEDPISDGCRLVLLAGPHHWSKVGPFCCWGQK